MAKDVQLLEISSSSLSSWVDRALCSASRGRLLKRLWAHDYTLWSALPDEISNRLDWLRLHETMPEKVNEIEDFVEQVIADGYEFALLLGMGGSSLAPEVFRKVFGVGEGCLNLAVLDSTDPEAVLSISQTLNLEKTLFIVSTKSGGTVETLSFFKYFYNQVKDQLGKAQAGDHFVAITDPGSKLEILAGEYSFRRTFRNNPNLGGRYSALSYFGLVPAALMGIDITRLLERAGQAASENSAETSPSKSQAVLLGTLLGKAHKTRVDKVTFISDPRIESFEDWVEQLVAESTGKSGKGILPVAHEPIPDQLDKYSKDRVFVFTQVGHNKKIDQLAAELTSAGHPCVHLRLEDQYDLGKLILLWEIAVAVAGVEMAIHPFNQPDVESAKQLARQTVAAYQQSGELPTGQAQTLSADALEGFVGTSRTGDYISLQAYIHPTAAAAKALHKLQAALRDKTGLAVTVGFGPRFLHSTGQLHKGDRGKGMFIQFVSHAAKEVHIPEKAGEDRSFITFGILKQAQAIGDAQALQQAGRRVIVFQVDPNPEKQLLKLAKQLQ
jgi:glucose-6-phosphate isomerase